MLNPRLKKAFMIGFIALGLAAGVAHAAVTLNGAGSTFVYPVLAKWADAYKAKTGISLNYQSIGSGGGIKQVKARTIDFGASDKPLSLEELNDAGLVQFPVVIGGVVPVVNLGGVKPAELRLTGPVLADIYLGKITEWNDPAIVNLNPGVALPRQKISVVSRADGSGTTYIFTNYLSKLSAEFRTKIGNNTSVAWPTGVGGKGNEGVASYVERLRGAIGYVEYTYALQNKMAYVQMQNKAGKFVKPEAVSFQAAAANAEWVRTLGFSAMLTDQPGEKSWPITGATFILVYKTQDKPETAHEVLQFFNWAYDNGDVIAGELDYVPIPDGVVKLVRETWKREIKDLSGNIVWNQPSRR